MALRWSPHPCVAALLGEGGAPLIGTSANPSGAPNPLSVEDVLRGIPAGIDLALDGGAIPPGAPSTLVDTTTRPLRLLRPGPIGLEALRGVTAGLVEPVE